MTTGKDFWLNVGGDMGEEKNVGRGRGRFSAAGVGLDVEARLTALEDLISDAVDKGELSPPDIDDLEDEDEAPA